MKCGCYNDCLYNGVGERNFEVAIINGYDDTHVKALLKNDFEHIIYFEAKKYDEITSSNKEV